MEDTPFLTLNVLTLLRLSARYSDVDITLLPAWGYDPLQPGDPRGSQRGVRTAF